MSTKGCEKEVRKRGKGVRGWMGRGEDEEKSRFYVRFFLWEAEITCCLFTSVVIDRLQKNMAGNKYMRTQFSSILCNNFDGYFFEQHIKTLAKESRVTILSILHV